MGEIETEEGIDPDHETEGDDHEVETDIGDAEVTAETETGTGDTGEAEVGTGEDLDPNPAPEGIRKSGSAERVEIQRIFPSIGFLLISAFDKKKNSSAVLYIPFHLLQ